MLGFAIFLNWYNVNGDFLMQLVKWFDRVWDIELTEGEPCKYIEDLISPLKYSKKWYHKVDKYLTFNSKPINVSKYRLTYTIKRIDNENNEELEFILYLVDKAVDYINNLETILVSDEEEEQPNDKEDIF